MSNLDQIRTAFVNASWFATPGAYVLVDGAYGSTGKGALAALIAAVLGDQIDVVTTNAGPNSGHTGYHVDGGEPVVTRQLPVASVIGRKLQWHLMMEHLCVPVYLNAGAVIDPIILKKEAEEFGVSHRQLIVHPCAAIIDDSYRVEPASVQAVASTGKGVGLALSRKVLRETNVAKFRQEILNYFCDVREFHWDWSKHRVFVETAQGFSLGINSRFYPFTTSRDCSVQQAISDAQIPWNKVRKVIMAVRSFPIRVGNTPDGNSGGCYPDQEETTWEALGVEPELTTVTKRVRRVFTWSRIQFREAVAANQPSSIFVTFCDYIKPSDMFEYGPGVGGFVIGLLTDYHKVMGCNPDFVLTARGPRPEDVELW